MNELSFFGNYDITTLAPRNGIVKLNITCDGIYDMFNTFKVNLYVSYNNTQLTETYDFYYNDGIAIELNTNNNEIIFGKMTHCFDSRIPVAPEYLTYLRSISISGDIINSTEFGFIPKFNNNNEANVNVTLHF